MKAFTLLQHREAGCNQVTGRYASDIIAKVITEGNKEICHPALCTYFNYGECPAYKKLKAMQPLSATKVVFTNKVADEMARLGLSKSAVRRQRRGG